MNIFLTEDINWDNYALISKYISSNYLSENVTINHLYGEHLRNVCNICNDNMFKLLRRSIDMKNPKKSIYDILKNMNMCIIFHNFVEYNTLSSFIIEFCEKNKIDYIIISEHIKGFYLNGVLSDNKFKKTICNISSNIKIPGDLIQIDREINLCKPDFQPKSIEDIIDKLRKNYREIENKRKEKAIIDIDAENSSMNKQIAYIDFMKQKKKWLKDVIPKS
tara:strand:- start:3128 stop:3787 length:660 start_codon:yes stop_codon:yes gene_type:complete